MGSDAHPYLFPLFSLHLLSSWIEEEVMLMLLLQRQIVSSVTQRSDEFEGESNCVGKSTKSSFQQKKNHPIRSPYEKTCVRFESGVSVQSESESRT